MVELRTLGTLAVTLRDGRTPSPSAMQPRRLALLVCIARSGERGIARDRLATMFWPDADEEAARRGVTQSLYGLRTGLDEAELILGVQELRLNPDVARCDVIEFESALAARQDERAATLFAGPFLDGFRVPNAPEFDRWMEETRSTLSGRHEAVLERLAKRATEGGDHLAAADWWRRRATGDPLNARVAVELMRALAASGDRSGALAHARVHGALVEQELGVAPDASVLRAIETLRETPLDTRTITPPFVPPAEPVPAALSAPASTLPSPAADVVPTVVVPAATPPVVPATTQVTTPMGQPRRKISGALALAGAALLVAAVAFGGRGWLQRSSETLHLGAPQRVSFDEGLELDADISPDGTQVAYVAGETGSLRLYVRQRGGSRAVPVLNELAYTSTGDLRRPRWSPDGQQLLYQGGRGIWTVPALGGTPRPLVEVPESPNAEAAYATWSPDGKSIAWVLDDTLFTGAIDAIGDRRNWQAHDARGEMHSLSWSPDGTWIAFVVGNVAFLYRALGNLAPSEVRLTRARCDIRRERCRSQTLLEPKSLQQSPVWRSPSELLYVSGEGGVRDIFAITVNPDGTRDGSPRRVTTGSDAASVTVAADGNTIAYSTLRFTSNVWSLALDRPTPLALNDAVRVTSGVQSVEGLDVTADGTMLVFDADRAGQQDIFTLPLNEGHAARTEADRIVDAPADDFHPVWSPDGRWIAYYTFRDGVRRAAVVSSQGGSPQLVHPDGENLEQYSPLWTRDGAALVYSRRLPTITQLFEARRLGDRSWAPERQVTTLGGTEASFADDGRVAYYANPTDMWMMDSTRMEATRRPIMPRADGSTHGLTVQFARISADGRTLLVKGNDAKGHGFWVCPLASGPPRLIVRLDDTQRPSVRAEFATDGRYLYFTRMERQADIWSVDLQKQ
ncbi:MAG TPA: BTAD domain-containing putative transcriptional regulator [Gemmatimonas sp.]|nr:BTAD domain-containing putative transcriptional regulator [Gemmatimonas sp.]